MYYRNIIKNRNVLLSHDILIKYPKEQYSQGFLRNKKGFLDLIQIQTNVDFKKYKGIAFASGELNKSEGVTVKDQSKLQLMTTYLTLLRITGQTPKNVEAKKSIANFNIRRGIYTGFKLDLRDESLNRIYKRLNMIGIPSEGEIRIKDKFKIKENTLYFKENKFNKNYFHSFKNLLNIQPFTKAFTGLLFTMNTVKDFKKYYLSNIKKDKKKLFLFSSLLLVNKKYRHLIHKNNNKHLLNYQYSLDHLYPELIDFQLKSVPEKLGVNIRYHTNIKLNNYSPLNTKFYILSYFLIPINI